MRVVLFEEVLRRLHQLAFELFQRTVRAFVRAGEDADTDTFKHAVGHVDYCVIQKEKKKVKKQL